MFLYGLIIGIAVVLCLHLFEKNNTVIPKNILNKFTIGFLLSLLIGARLYHVVDHWNYYSQNLLQILNTRNGGLGIIGALIFGFFFILFFSQKYHLKFLSISDQVFRFLPLGQSIGRLGNFVNHEISIWWLESILCLFLFFYQNKYRHHTTETYLIGYGAIRILTEIFRNDTWTISQIKIAHLISLFFVLMGIFLLKYRTRLRRLVGQP